MDRAELEKLIIEDLENGLKYREIMKKRGLKSNYLIKKIKGKKTEGNYLKIFVSVNALNNASEKDLKTLHKHLEKINKILKCKNIQKILNYINFLQNTSEV